MAVGAVVRGANSRLPGSLGLGSVLVRLRQHESEVSAAWMWGRTDGQLCWGVDRWTALWGAPPCRLQRRPTPGCPQRRQGHVRKGGTHWVRRVLICSWWQVPPSRWLPGTCLTVGTAPTCLCSPPGPSPVRGPGGHQPTGT